MSNLTPIVFSSNGMAADIYSTLLQKRIIYVGDIDKDSANSAVAQLLYLSQLGKDPISIYINSNGGNVTDGLSIIDTIKHVESKGIIVATTCVGICASMGAVILAAGTKGHRSILQNSYTMIHQVSGGAMGTSSDIELAFGFMTSLGERLNSILSQYTGQTLEKVKADSNRDFYQNSEQSVAYGLCDKVVA
tara:strand:+ start:12691 stop:13263 length:573 start_codon:yes stop_codon:yes gene_type:complete